MLKLKTDTHASKKYKILNPKNHRISDEMTEQEVIYALHVILIFIE